MLFSGNDFIDTSTSFDVTLRSEDDGKIFLKAYATSGMILKTPYMIIRSASGYQSTAVLASAGSLGYVNTWGVPPEAVASGCTGWVQVRGYCSDMQCFATGVDGSQGHAIFASGTKVVGTNTAFTGLEAQFAIMMEDQGAGGSTTANVWLVGDTQTVSKASG